VNLLRKYLNYSEASRKRVGSAGYIEALYRDSVDVVDRGYCQLFPCFQALGKIVAVIIWGAIQAPIMLPFVVILVLIVFTRLRLRERATTKLRLLLFQAQNWMLTHAEVVTRNFTLVRDYRRRPLMAQRMDTMVAKVNHYINAVWHKTTGTKLATPIVSGLGVAVLIAAAPQVTRRYMNPTRCIVATQTVHTSRWRRSWWAPTRGRPGWASRREGCRSACSWRRSTR